MRFTHRCPVDRPVAARPTPPHLLRWQRACSARGVHSSARWGAIGWLMAALVLAGVSSGATDGDDGRPGGILKGQVRAPQGCDDLPPLVVSIQPPTGADGQPIGDSDKARVLPDGTFDFGRITPRRASLGVLASVDYLRDACLMQTPAIAVTLLDGETRQVEVPLPFVAAFAVKVIDSTSGDDQPLPARLHANVIPRPTKGKSAARRVEPVPAVWSSSQQNVAFSGDGKVWLGLGEGDIALQVVKPGYRTARRIVRVSREDHPGSLEFRLDPLPTAWSTRLVDTQGAPLRNAELNHEGGVETVTADADGNIDVDFLPPGVYHFTVMVPRPDGPTFAFGVEIDLTKPADSLRVDLRSDR